MLGVSQKKRKAVVRRESADTQEYESCKLNDMDVHMDENKEEFSFIPSAVSSSAGWREPLFMCDRQRWKKRFQHFDAASVTLAESCTR